MLQLEEDVRDECAEYGTVEGICIPVPPKTLPPDEPGRAYILFASHEEAIKAKPVFDGRLLDSVKITAKLVPDDDFQRAAAGEWIHIPIAGGLPAHPGLASCPTVQGWSRQVTIVKNCSWRFAGVAQTLQQYLACMHESALQMQ